MKAITFSIDKRLHYSMQAQATREKFSLESQFRNLLARFLGAKFSVEKNQANESHERATLAEKSLATARSARNILKLKDHKFTRDEMNEH